jgi:hypothetical protein
MFLRDPDIHDRILASRSREWVDRTLPSGQRVGGRGRHSDQQDELPRSSCGCRNRSRYRSCVLARLKERQRALDVRLSYSPKTILCNVPGAR